MIKYVIFDMDGTLFDTEPCFEKSWSETGDRWGLKGMREMYYPQVAGRSIDIIKQFLKSCYGESFDSEAYFAERWVQFRELVSNGVEEKRGCYELLRFLKEHGIKAALATSTPKDLASLYLYKSQIPDYLDGIVFIAFDYDNLVKVKKLRPNQTVQFLTKEVSDELIDKLAAAGMDADIHHPSLTKERIDAFHAKGVKLNCWTVDKPERAEELAAWGVDFITSNILE